MEAGLALNFKTMYTVKIKREHIEFDRIQEQYDEPLNCPLFKAIEEQLPDFPLYGIGSSGMVMGNRDIHYKSFFPVEGGNKWNLDILGDFISSGKEEYIYSFE